MNGNKEPLVSIIVNCYNSDKYLKETLESIINQSYKNWQVIFWDNQSTDRSAEYLKSYAEPRFKYFYAPEFTSLSTARNLAVQKAEGELLAFLDCDDIWIKEKLTLQIPLFNNPNVGLIYSAFDLILQSTSVSAMHMFNSFSRMGCEQHGIKNIYTKLLKSNYIIFSTIIIRKEVFQLTGGFTNEFRHNEDYEILLKASLHCDAVCIKEHTTKYRIHGGNNSFENEMVSYDEIRLILNNLPPSKYVTRAININDARSLISKISHNQKKLAINFLVNRKLFWGLIGLIKRKASTVLFKRRALC